MKRLIILAILAVMLFTHRYSAGGVWQLFAFENESIYDIAISLNATFIAVYGGEDKGIWRNANNKIWEHVLKNVNVKFITISPYNENIIYAGTEGNSLYVSPNSGNSWEQKIVSQNLSTAWNVECVAVDPSDETGKTIYLGGNDLWKSVNGGQTWTIIHDDNGKYASIAFDEEKKGVYAVNEKNGVLKFVPGYDWAYKNAGFEMFGNEFTEIRVIDPDNLICGTIEAVYFSENGGDYWQSFPNSPSYITDILVMDNEKCYMTSSYEGISLSRKNDDSWSFVLVNAGLEKIGITSIAKKEGYLYAAGIGLYLMYSEEEINEKGCFISLLDMSFL